MIPYDATQHIQGIAQGAANAMPGIQTAINNGKAGSPTLQRFIDEFNARVSGGEHPKSVSDDLFSQWENDIRNGVQHTDVNVPDVGFNNGVPAIGNGAAGGALAQPIAQAPNSFGGGSFNGATPPPAAMGGGVTSNAAPAQPAQPLPPINNQPVNVPPNTMNGSQATVSRPPPDELTPLSKIEDKPIPYQETPKIDLTKGRMGGNMQTKDSQGVKAAPPMNRGEQEQSMFDIERVKKLESSDNGAQFKRDKLEMESKIKILKAMSNRLSDKEKRELMATLGEAGMTTRAQIAVMNATIRAKNAEDMNKTRQESNRIKANKASDKIDPKVQHLWTRYKAAVDEIKGYNTSLVAGDNGNPARVKQLKKIAANELHAYNMAAIENGLPERTAEDLKTPEVYGDNDPNNRVEE